MKYETIIIGGGLSGLLSGIALARSGRSVAIISAGQSALHFSSGSFELLNRAVNPLEGLESLDDSHPYRKIGKELLIKYTNDFVTFATEAGMKINGDATRNHYRLSPIGLLKPAWLTLDDYAAFDNDEHLPWRKVAIFNLNGYLDFYPKFLISGLSKKGIECEVSTLTIPQLENLRKSTTEMRAANIARVMTGETISAIAKEINAHIGAVNAVLMPAVFGLFDNSPVEQLRSLVNVPVYFVPTMPASVPGVRTQIQLRKYFQQLGGTYFIGDNVTEGTLNGNRLESITTMNHGDMEFTADNFILATGSFFSHGIIASQAKVYEPIFGLDVEAHDQRENWCNIDLYKEQPYMKYGVITDAGFHAMTGGVTIENVYAAGSILAGQNAIEDGCGAGVAITTALHVANQIINA